MAEIRDATVRDLSEIVRLYHQASVHQARLDGRLEPTDSDARRISRVLRSMISMPDVSVLVGEAEGFNGLAGFTLGSIVDNKPFAVSRFGYVGCLSVDRRHRQQGLGGELWMAVSRWLTGKGLATAQTDVSVSNTLTRTFWRDRGFESYLDHFRRDIEPELRETGTVDCEIRRATPADIDSILILWKEMMDIHAAIDERLAVGPMWSEQVVDFVEQWLRSPEDRLIVADAHPGVIGFAVGSVLDTTIGLKPSRYGHVAHLCVRADVRRRGVGRRLFGELRDWFRQRQLASIHLCASHFNLTSQSFWRSLGFEACAERQWCNLV